MKKVKTDIIQYKPYITIIKIPIVAAEISENFTYLGKDFNISMNCDHVKEQFTKDITKYLQKIYFLPLHPLQKRFANYTYSLNINGDSQFTTLVRLG